MWKLLERKGKEGGKPNWSTTADVAGAPWCCEEPSWTGFILGYMMVLMTWQEWASLCRRLWRAMKWQIRIKSKRWLEVAGADWEAVEECFLEVVVAQKTSRIRVGAPGQGHGCTKPPSKLDSMCACSPPPCPFYTAAAVVGGASAAILPSPCRPPLCSGQPILFANNFEYALWKYHISWRDSCPDNDRSYQPHPVDANLQLE